MTEASDGMEVKHSVATSSSSSLHNCRQPPAVCPSSASYSGFPENASCSPNAIADAVKGNAVLATASGASSMKVQSFAAGGVPSRPSAPAAAAAAALASRTNILTSGTLPVNAGAGPPLSSSSAAHVLEAAKLQQQLMFGAAQSVTGPVTAVSSSSTTSHLSRPVSPAVSNVSNSFTGGNRDATDGRLDSLKNAQQTSIGGLRADSPLMTSRSRPTTPVPPLQQPVHAVSIALATPNVNSVATTRGIQPQSVHAMHSAPGSGVGSYVNAYPGQPAHAILPGQRSGTSSSPSSRPDSPTALGQGMMRRNVPTPPVVAVPVQSSGNSVFTSALAMAGSTLNAPSSSAGPRAIPQSLANDRHHFATSGMSTPVGNVTSVADLRTNERLMTGPAYYTSMDGFSTSLPMPFPLSNQPIGLRPPPAAIVGGAGGVSGGGGGVRPPGVPYLVSGEHRVVLPSMMDSNNGGYFIPNYVTAPKFNQSIVPPKTSGATTAHLNNISSSEQPSVRQTQAPAPPSSPTTNSSPRPGILLRKRTSDGMRKTAGGTSADIGLTNGDVADSLAVSRTGVPARSPDAGLESSAPTLPHSAPPRSVISRHNLEEPTALIETASPRKKQRKQGLVTAEDPLASNVPEPNHTVVNNAPAVPAPAPPPPKPKEAISQFPFRRRMPVHYGGGYRPQGKVAVNHFQRTSDVRIKEERKQSVGEFASQNARLLASLSGRVQRICSNLDTVCEVEEKKAEFYYKHLLQKSHDGKLRNEIEAMIDLLQGNIQRSKAMIEQISEAKQTLLKLHEQHRDRVSELLTRFSAQKSSRKKSS